MKLLLDGRIVAAPDEGMAGLPAGPGVFETLLVRDGAPVFFGEHWARFAAGCRWHGFDLPAPPDEVERLARLLAEENKVRTGVLRFVLSRAGERLAWRVEVRPPRGHMARRDFRVCLEPALPAAVEARPFKHLDRGPWMEALRTARAAGWDEVILTDRAGRLVEGGGSNVFFVRDGGLHTPAVELGPLPGIMRGRVLALARVMGLTVEEGTYAGADLERASEIWLSNSLIGLRAVSVLGDRVLEEGSPVLLRFRARWRLEYGWDPVVVTALS
jgi:branched-subunit amino acid aminotransferase/4-amino-4-deoxychorismate lyase